MILNLIFTMFVACCAFFVVCSYLIRCLSLRCSWFVLTLLVACFYLVYSWFLPFWLLVFTLFVVCSYLVCCLFLRCSWFVLTLLVASLYLIFSLFLPGLLLLRISKPIYKLFFSKVLSFYHQPKVTSSVATVIM